MSRSPKALARTTSRNMMNKSGDNNHNMQPWRTPTMVANHSVMFPFNLTALRVSEYYALEDSDHFLWISHLTINKNVKTFETAMSVSIV